MNLNMLLFCLSILFVGGGRPEVLISLPPNLKNSGAFSPGAREGFTNFFSATIFLLGKRVLGLIFTSS